MLAPNPKRPLLLVIALGVALLFVCYNRNTRRLYGNWTSSLDAYPASRPANRTLGFGAVVVVSREGSSRRHSLVQAINVTGIDVVIPQQPRWTEDDLAKFQNAQWDGAHRGSMLAWLGHRSALQWFLDSSMETALILEDDVDWDIHLRSIQIPLAAKAARTIMPPKQRQGRSLALVREMSAQYWGNSSVWDLLYLGHCGDYFNEVSYGGLSDGSQPYNLSDTPHVVYSDPTLPAQTDLHPFTQELFNRLRIPEHSRVLHRSKFPLCSFGYAITRTAAEHLLKNLAPAKLAPKGPRAFDVALLHACIKGNIDSSSIPNPWEHLQLHPERGLRCWTLNSELFHHMPGVSEIAVVGKIMGEGPEQGIPPVDLVGQAQVERRNETTNIGCGFWSGDFQFEEGDRERLVFLRENVGRRGMCLKKPSS